MAYRKRIAPAVAFDLGRRRAVHQSVEPVEAPRVVVPSFADPGSAFLEEYYARYPLVHLLKVHHRNLANEEMSFRGRKWMRLIAEQLLQPDHKVVYVEKCTQVGISEVFLAEAIYYAGEMGLQVMWTMPSLDARARFVKTRFDTLVNKVAYYRTMLDAASKGGDSERLKKLRNGLINFAGTNSPVEMTSQPADVRFHDEYDLSDHEIMRRAKGRDKASKHKRVRIISNPTAPKFGISLLMADSNQQKWFVLCPKKSCEHPQNMDWYKHVVIPTSSDRTEYKLRDNAWKRSDARDIYILCERCGDPLDRFTNDSFWAITNLAAESEAQGYQISQLMSPTVYLRELWEEFKLAQEDPAEMEFFHRDNLGEPFLSGSQKADETDLEECEGDWFNQDSSSEPTVFGIDVGEVGGHYATICLANRPTREVIAFKRIRNFEELEELFIRFNMVYGVIDSEPESEKSRDLQQKKRWNGKLWRIKTVNPRGGAEKMQDVNKDHITHYMVVKRNTVIGMERFEIQQRSVRYPKHLKTIEGGAVAAHLCALVKIFDRTTGKYYFVNQGPDHFALSDVYNSAGFRMYKGLGFDSLVYRKDRGEAEPAEINFGLKPVRLGRAQGIMMGLNPDKQTKLPDGRPIIWYDERDLERQGGYGTRSFRSGFSRTPNWTEI